MSSIDQNGTPTQNRDEDLIRARLIQIANAADDAGAHDLQRLSASLVDLTVVADTAKKSTAETGLRSEILDFCRQTLPTVEQSLTDYPQSLIRIQETIDTLEDRWGHYLELLTDAERFSNEEIPQWEQFSPGWGNATDVTEDDSQDLDFSVGDVTQLLAGLGKLESGIEPPSSLPHQVNFASETSHAESTISASDLIQETLDDPELIPAYVDDAQQCLAGMEMCLLELDSNRNAQEPLRQFCRELHTLKGASGTVGLNGLAEYLHGLENSIEAMSTGGAEVNIDLLLKGVDFVRLQLEKFVPQSSGSAVETSIVPQTSQNEVTGDVAAESYVRIEASRLDRLMDLLAELVMLRNRRETYVSSLQRLDHETSSCATRLRLIDTSTLHQVSSSPGLDTSCEAFELTDQLHQQNRLEGNRLSAGLTELAKDVSEIGRQMREVCDPLSKDNSTISHLIGCFRGELMELRRQPIAGLFRRLYRVARDAGKAEGRQVELQFTGQGTRAERALQERLYEPLMHIIRNAVSHGIENSAERLQAGKPAAGQITLNAAADAGTLYIEVRDDGRGLNTQVLERKGRELGLLQRGSTPSQKQLWELILQPGFSTKTEVSQISGRGVGMDVVASQLRSMRGRVSIDSVYGEYTTFRLEVPLRSTIEHAMIVRCGEQLLALPMHSVYGAHTGDEMPPKQNVVGLHELLGIRSSTGSHRVVTLRHQKLASVVQATGTQPQGTLAIGVDAVVGVEEVVIRSFPPLLRNHDCFSGVTLSGEAETVLVVDVPRLAEFVGTGNVTTVDESVETCGAKRPGGSESSRRNEHGHPSHKQRVLIVDDSMTVRRSLVHKLKSHGFELVEAVDGKQALDCLREGEFLGVVSDLDMPKMNGIEFITEVRRTKQFADLPIVVLTGRRDAASLEAVSQLNVKRTFQKPVSDATVKSIAQSLRYQPSLK